MAAPGQFEILARDPATRARAGRLWTAHGPVDTPVFMPVGTQATVKAMSPAELQALGAPMLLVNTYHVHVRPGMDVLSKCGGLHRFMGWNGPILTDSGGYQVFSLARLRKVRADGVEFQSHVDGKRIFLGPAEAMAIQRELGSDVAMVLDECPPFPCSRDCACQAVEKTLAWAALCSREARAEGQLVFGIVQGSTHADLRVECARRLLEIGFDGYAIGGVSVGESHEAILQATRDSLEELPSDRPRYLMGVGNRSQILDAVALGVDMFDCVMPTRFARNGTAFTRRGRYPVKAGKYRCDGRPIESGCSCDACAGFSRAYVRHLLNVGEILGARLLTLHNLHRYMEFMREIRSAIADGALEALRRAWREDAAGDRADE